MAYPEDVRYTQTHEWAREEGGLVTVGITSHATELLGDVVFVDLPAAGTKVEAQEKFGEIEAVKTVSDLFAPVAGEIVEVNAALGDNPPLVNQAPFGEGWMIKIKPANSGDLGQLLDSLAYEKLAEEGGH